MSRRTHLTAIDLYSGVGGWSLGLKMSGIKVLGSYEQWEAANRTNNANNHHTTHQTDIRKLKLNSLPAVDIVVGSPPCTQFSYSNRGGNGDIEDGLVDIRKFLSIVRYLKPKVWAMENVPRVAKVLQRELQPGRSLSSFADLAMNIHILRMEEYGLPQRRRRCIAGNFNYDILSSYSNKLDPHTLGDVVSALRKKTVSDTLYGISIGKAALKDHVTEPYLTDEEARINRAAKVSHVVYNAMPFPDPLDRQSRTITATCTRVSRESIVIATKAKPGHFRRLTIRERATLQGFPISFQFFGETYSQKIRMVGNAVPPPIAFYLGHAFQNTAASDLPTLAEAFKKLKWSVPAPPQTPPDRASASFPANRSFRFAARSLQLKSGVRFELRNQPWEMALVFGTPSSIHDLALTKKISVSLLRGLPKQNQQNILARLDGLKKYLGELDTASMQAMWTRRATDGVHPFLILDKIEREGRAIRKLLGKYKLATSKAVKDRIRKEFGTEYSELAGVTKLINNSPLVLAGLLISTTVNAALKEA